MTVTWFVISFLCASYANSLAVLYTNPFVELQTVKEIITVCITLGGFWGMTTMMCFEPATDRVVTRRMRV